MRTGAGAQGEVAEALAALLLGDAPPVRAVEHAKLEEQLAACHAVARGDATRCVSALTTALAGTDTDNAPSTDRMLAICVLAIFRLALVRRAPQDGDGLRGISELVGSFAGHLRQGPVTPRLVGVTGHLEHEPEAGLRDRAMLEVLYATGIRRSELCNLTLERGVLTRRRSSSTSCCS